MKRKYFKRVAMTMVCILTAGMIASCSCSKESEKTDDTKDQALPQLSSWNGVKIKSEGSKDGEVVISGSGISVAEDSGLESNVIKLEGKDGYLELPENIWSSVKDEFTISYRYKADTDCPDNANVFQTNICGYGVGDTYWRDAPEISLTMGGTIRAYVGGRTIDGVYNPNSTYNNGVGDDDKAYSEPNGHKTRYSGTIEAFEKDKWNQVIISVSKSELHIYVNGTEKTITKETQTDEISSTLEYLFGTYESGENVLLKYVNTSIGNSVYSDVPNFKGSVDYICVYNRALKDDEISSLPKDADYIWNFNTKDIVVENNNQTSDLSKYMGETALTEVSELTTASPDGKTKIQIWNDSKGSYYYSVIDGEQVIIESSIIGMDLTEGNLWEGLSYEENSKQTKEINETYSIITGSSSTAKNHCNETSFILKNDKGSFTFVLRAYNDGIGYRYTDVKTGDKDSITVSDEKSEVILPKSGTTWAFQLNATYEGEYIKRTSGQLEALSQTLSTPMLANIGNYWVLLTEAAAFNNDGQYCTSGLKTEKGSVNLLWTFGLKRDPNKEATGELDSPGHLNITEVNTVNGFTTPWRVAVISDNLEEFSNSSIIGNFNPEPDKDLFADTSYIKPGKVAWSWWSEGDVQGDYNKHIEYIDFAAENGWEYVCLDAGWRAFENKISEMCQYAENKGVGLFVWVNYRDIKDKSNMEKLFAEWKAAGVVGLKTDYFESDTGDVLKVMQDTAICCAENKLMVLFHGSVRPGGEYRTYPNVLTMESVQGEEWHKWFAYPTIENCLMYTFTRNICGSMDYTPVGTKVGSNEATYGFGLAQTIVYESALQHFAYSASSYKSYSGLALLNNIPVTWDESKLVEGYPGEYVTYARRNGDNWFIGSMTSESRKVTISLDFLDEGTYNAYVYEDNEDGSQLIHSEKTVSKSDKLELELCANGGAAVMITKDTIDTSIGESEEFNNPKDNYFEAESKLNTLSGAAVTAGSAFCSGSQKVGYVGNGAGNTLTFNNINVDKDGTYKFKLYYCCGEDRKVTITVNGSKEYTLEKLNSGDYVHTNVAEIEIKLNKGNNTIMLSNPSYYAPDIDRIAISKEAK